MSRVVTLPSDLGAAIREFLATGDFQASTRVVYERTLEAFLEDLGAVALERISWNRLEDHLRDHHGHCAPATVNRHLAAIGSLFAWAVDHDHLAVPPAAKIGRRKERRSRLPEHQANAIPIAELQALWRDPRHHLRDQAFWALAYSTSRGPRSC